MIRVLHLGVNSSRDGKIREILELPGAYEVCADEICEPSKDVYLERKGVGAFGTTDIAI